jgi:hypothetical protein
VLALISRTKFSLCSISEQSPCKLYPSSAQEALLWRKKVLLKDLWNAALEERDGRPKGCRQAA